MRHSHSRYIQPHNTFEAMSVIQKLFNKYRHAPLTKELLDYHNHLIDRLNSDIKAAAEKEGDPKRLKDLASMVDIMQRWTSIRMSGQPYPGKMRHFKFVTDGSIKFKRVPHRQGSSNNYRATRH